MATRTVDGWTFDDPEPVVGTVYSWKMPIITAVLGLLVTGGLAVMLRNPLAVTGEAVLLLLMSPMILLAAWGIVLGRKVRLAPGPTVRLLSGLSPESGQFRQTCRVSAEDGELVFRSVSNDRIVARLGRDALAAIRFPRPTILPGHDAEPIPSYRLGVDVPLSYRNEWSRLCARTTALESSLWPSPVGAEVRFASMAPAWALVPVVAATGGAGSLLMPLDSPGVGIGLAGFLGFAIGPGLLWLERAESLARQGRRERWERTFIAEEVGGGEPARVSSKT